MIKNDKQNVITKKKLEEFNKSLEKLKMFDDKDLMNKIRIESIKSQMETFKREIDEYEMLKNKKPNILSSTIENLPETLIKARIIKGISQKELAEKVGLKEQQIQRYEANNYSSANFERLIVISKSMGLTFEETRAVLEPKKIEINGIDPEFLRIATCKLHSRRTLLTV